MKRWWKSKTIGFGLLTILAGAATQFTDLVKTESPGEVPAWLLILAGAGTIVLRYVTKDPIE